MSTEMFYVGQTFSCKEDILCFFKEFCSIYYQPLTIRNSSKERVVFKCCHGRRRKSMCTGQRPNQHHLFKNCEVQINVWKTTKNFWKVTKVDLQHNHDIGRMQYDLYGRRRKLEGNDYKLISDLVKVKTKDSVIADVLKKKNNKFLTRKDIQNIRNKMFLMSPEEKEEDLKYLPAENDENAEVIETMSVEDTAPENVNIYKDKGNNDKEKTLTDTEKFKIVSEVTKEINKIVNAHGTQKCLKYIKELKNFLELARQGESVAVSVQSSQSCKLTKEPESPESSVSNENENFMLKFQEKVK